MQIQFCGAAREVTGSSHLITLEDGYKILLDCGLYQGYDKAMEDFNETWRFDPKEIDCVVLSHAHIDHCGRLPKLVKDGFEGPIYSTHATCSLCNIMLMDSAGIQEKDAEFDAKQRKKKKHYDSPPELPLYTTKDIPPTMERFVGVGYERWFEIQPKVRVLFRDAGHILGSASVTLEINEGGKKRLIGFTGDVGRPSRPILRDPLPMPEVDFLIMESTYGDRDHEAAPGELEHFLKVVQHTCVDKKGKLIIPAFSVGRTQEVVYMLDQLANEGRLPRVKVYVDSPLAVNATRVFGAHPECYDEELMEYMLSDPNPFGFNDLKYITKVEESKLLNERKEPCVIISSSGMANAGRIRHHLFNNLADADNTVLMVGYCSPETPGGKLRAGAKAIKLFGEMVPVNAEIQIMDSFSGHADRNELLEFVRNQRGHVKEIQLVHGDEDAQEALKTRLETFGFSKVGIPSLGESIHI